MGENSPLVKMDCIPFLLLYVRKYQMNSLIFLVDLFEAGFIEPGVKISCPSNVAVLELLMSLNPDSRFAFARPSNDQ